MTAASFPNRTLSIERHAMSDQKQQEAAPPAKGLLDMSDMIILIVVGVLTAMYFYTRNQGKKSVVPVAPTAISTAQKTDAKPGAAR